MPQGKLNIMKIDVIINDVHLIGRDNHDFTIHHMIHSHVGTKHLYNV